MTVEDSAFWTMVGTWFTGIATFGAVVTSLFMGFRTPKVKLKVSIGERILISKSLVSTERSGISFEITNLSLQPAVISRINWKLKKDHWLYQEFGDPSSDILPKTLEHGEVCRLWISTQANDPFGGIDWYGDIAEVLNKLGIPSQKIWCYISTSTGQSFKLKPEKGIVDQLKQRCDELKSNSNDKPKL